MPLTVVAPSATPRVESLRERRLRRGALRDRGRRLTIALVNNMPDAALLATQRQFSGLLEEGAGEFDLSLTLWTLENVARSQETRREMSLDYGVASGLRRAPPDALIVTGAEPLTANLEDEPYWSELTGLADWARASVVSTLASCLAAHALTQHQSGVRRRKLAAKRSGVYAVDVIDRHPLTQGMPDVVAVPHSRWNDLDERELILKGYRILRRSQEAGVDAFVSGGEHLQVFLQGHPEYDADTLAREYRRDAMRSLRSQSPPPAPPAHYFSNEAAEALRAFLIEAAANPAAVAFPSQWLEGIEADWRAPSVMLFRNWLGEVAARKAAANPASEAKARWGG